MRTIGIDLAAGAPVSEAGFPVDRAAEGRLFEVYPGGSLRLWGFDTTGYRVDAERRRALLDTLSSRAPWLDFAGFAPRAVATADAFDAVIAALATRAAALGMFEPPASEMLDVARREGWVALPDGPVEGLAPPAASCLDDGGGGL